MVPVVVVLGEVIAQDMAGLHATSRRDDLTGVGNRRYGMEVLERLRPGDAVLILDLDRFKDVNDREGHAGGDAVLAELGTMLRQTMRGADVVARLGGEEFLVVATQAGSAAAGLAERLVRDWRETAPRTTISVGATLHRRGDAPSQALARADEALYRAKRAGRDRSCYSPPTAQPAVELVRGAARVARLRSPQTREAGSSIRSARSVDQGHSPRPDRRCRISTDSITRRARSTPRGASLPWRRRSLVLRACSSSEA
jgi:diguanylate cyclase (GGDEF)-like protein